MRMTIKELRKMVRRQLLESSYTDLLNKFNIGTKFEVRGWIMLKGVDAGIYIVTQISEDHTAMKFRKLGRSGNPIGKEFHFRTGDIATKMGNPLDNNGVTIVESIASLHEATPSTVGKPETMDEPEEVKYTKPEKDLSTITVGDLALIIKYKYTGLKDEDKPKVIALTRIKDLQTMYENQPAVEVAKDVLSCIGGWTGKLAKDIKLELKRRVDEVG